MQQEIEAKIRNATNKSTGGVLDIISAIDDYQEIINKYADYLSYEFKADIHEKIFHCCFNIAIDGDIALRDKYRNKAFDEIAVAIRFTMTLDESIAYRLCHRALLCAMCHYFEPMAIDIETAFMVVPDFHYCYYVYAVKYVNLGQLDMAVKFTTHAINLCANPEQKRIYLQYQQGCLELSASAVTATQEKSQVGGRESSKPEPKESYASPRGIFGTPELRGRDEPLRGNGASASLNMSSL